MKFRFSRLCSIDTCGGFIVVLSHINGVAVNLFETSYIDEFRGLLDRKGTDSLESELEIALFNNKILVPFDEKELVAAEQIIRDSDGETFQLILYPTEKCNLRCVYCYETFQPNELTCNHYDILTNEVEDALRNKKKNIIVSWFGGEPLLKLNDILAFSNRIRRLSTEHSANSVGSITTNGVLLSSDTHKALTENGVNVYQITLDGYAHNRQRKYADGTGTFEVVLNNILQMLNSNLDFSLAIRVNISAESFDFSFYELFSAFKNDERVAFLIKPISKWSEDLYLPILEGESARNAVKLHEHHLRSLGFSLFNNCVGIDSGSCYASKKDMLAVRSDGRVQRCTVHLEDELNNIGYVDIENGRIVIDREKEQLWTDSSMNPECYACEELATCFNRSCPWKRITGNTGLCCK